MISLPVIRHKGTGLVAGGFRVPFGPYLVPGLSIVACIYIMKDLSTTTFHAFFVWMVVAVLSYFVYGIRNSKLNAIG